MRFVRPASAVLATAVLAAAAYTAPASAEIAGVGTSLSSTKVLSAQLGGGQLLDLLLLGDEARSTIDPAVGTPEAYSRLTAVKATSAIVPNSPINVDKSFEAKSAGPSEVAIPGTSFASNLPLALAPVISGNVDPGKLTATVLNGTAAAGLNVKLSNISALGGLLSIDSLTSTMGASSAGSASDAVRGVAVQNIKVLNLGSLLQGLGLPLGALTPKQVIALVDALAASTGLPLPSGTTTLAQAVTTLNQAIDNLQAAATTGATASTVAQVTNTIDTTTNTLLGTVGLVSPLGTTTTVVAQVVTTVNDLINQLQALLNGLLAKGLASLDNLALLSLEGVQVGVATKALDTVEASSATVTGSIGKVLVGGVALPGIDLNQATTAINANVAAINAKLGSILSLVSPDLANIVQVSVLDKATSVTSSGGYVRSRAGLTAASATITPPANLAAIVKTITDQVGVAQTLAGTTVGVPALSSAMNDLGFVLKASSSVLTSPSKVQVASVLSASDFARAGGGVTTTGAPGSPSDPGSTLPRTGGTDLILLGGLAGVLALAIRRLVRTPAVRPVRIDTK